MNASFREEYAEQMHQHRKLMRIRRYACRRLKVYIDWALGEELTTPAILLGVKQLRERSVRRYGYQFRRKNHTYRKPR